MVLIAVTGGLAEVPLYEHFLQRFLEAITKDHSKPETRRCVALIYATAFR